MDVVALLGSVVFCALAVCVHVLRRIYGFISQFTL